MWRFSLLLLVFLTRPAYAERQVTVHYASFSAGLPKVNYGVKYRSGEYEGSISFFPQTWITGTVVGFAKQWRFQPRSKFVPYVALGGGYTPGLFLGAPATGFEYRISSASIRFESYGYIMVPTGMFFMLPTLGLGWVF